VRAIGVRRQLAGLAVAAAGLPALTAILVAVGDNLALVDHLLLYLLAVIGVTVVGGFWPAIVAASASSLIVNWYFTPPRHTWTISAPQNLLALLLFVAAAVSISGVVHLAARRATAVARSTADAETMLGLAQMRTALLTAVGHDLRTPLASVKAAVSSLRQTDVNWSAADHAELLATIEEGADRLDGLIANLLDMSRINAGSLLPLLRPTAVDEVVPMALRGQDADIRIDLPEELPLVAADPGLLERAIANLVANAVRYSPPGQPAAITATLDGATVRLDVVDHGPGVPPGLREQIFQPFQQLGDQRDGGGVGLGLAVARGFVEALSGELTASTTPGGGLTMTIRLPVATDEASPARPVTTSGRRSR
jgi:two-component system sensor histidine kinase KdpD